MVAATEAACGLGVFVIAANSCVVQWFLELPWPAALLLIVLVFSAAACYGHVLVRRAVPPKDLVQHNDVAGFIISIVGVLYAVLLGFVVIVTWQQWDGSRSHVDQEASALSDIHNLIAAYGSRRIPIDQAIDRFITLEVNQEWPAMERGKSSDEARRALRTLEHRIASLKPNSNDPRENAAFQKSIDLVIGLEDLRRQRLADNSNSLPPALWVCLVIGGLLTIAFGYLFGVEHFRAQLFMTAAVASAVALQLFLIIELDYPFRGSIAVPPGAYIDVQRQFAAESDRDYSLNK